MSHQVHLRLADGLYERVKAKQAGFGLTLNQTLLVLVAQGLEPRVLVQMPEAQMYVQPPEAETYGGPGDWEIQAGS
jgi:hypothetical protein